VTASVAVVVPVFRDRLGPDEELSLRHLRAHLGAYDGFAFCPASLDLEVPDLAPVRLDDRHFRTHRDYSRLMLSGGFYRRFERYEFVLVHQLDCVVFSDELARWCGERYDYVGAPWVRRGADGRPFFAGVGNGGLSLRRVESFLRVLERRVRATVAVRHVGELVRRIVREPRRARQLLRDRYVYEDKFWSLEAPRLDPGFRIPPAETAVAFAFESEPRFCFEQNGGRLPFGCHKWRAHDPEFWAPYLLA
jgi:Protein of unknown function (DUF5672)